MGVPTLEVGYTSATTGRGDHEVHKGHVVVLEKKKLVLYYVIYSSSHNAMLKQRLFLFHSIIVVK
jgi:hypothetical protein